MRTTIDLPKDLHDMARALAHQHRRSMSDVIADLIRNGLREDDREFETSVRGLPRISIGRPVTSEDVASLDDDDDGS